MESKICRDGFTVTEVYSNTHQFSIVGMKLIEFFNFSDPLCSVCVCVCVCNAVHIFTRC